MKRRNFLKASAAFAGAAAGGFSCMAIAGAAPIEVPVIDKLSVLCMLAPDCTRPLGANRRCRSL